MSLLQAADLGYRIGQRNLLAGVFLSIEPGDNIALLGANGAGKSTLLRLLLGLLKPSCGEVRIDGRSLTELSRRDIARQLAYVPQTHVPSFPYSVEQIVGQGRLPTTGLLRAADAVDRAAVQRALLEMDVEHLRARLYTQLSGGERQRVLIADGEPRSVIDSTLMQRLYQIQVRQIDAHGQRFFIPL